MNSSMSAAPSSFVSGSMPVPPPRMPLNQRLAAALDRLGSNVNRTETILNRLRDPGPEVASPLDEPQSHAHELLDRFEVALDRLDRNTNTIIDLL